MADCQLTIAPFYQCCCKCKFHLKEYYSCTPENHAKGLCFTQKGWVCASPESDGVPIVVYGEWPEHSCGCELYTPIDKP